MKRRILYGFRTGISLSCVKIGNLINFYCLFIRRLKANLTFVPQVAFGIVCLSKQYQDHNFRFETNKKSGLIFSVEFTEDKYNAADSTRGA